MGAASAVLGLEPIPGERLRYFGDYELIQEIARGGMGVVYAARQVSLNRIVAVKRLLESALATPEQVRRFQAEAEAAARLRHPNIVGIHEIGEHEGQRYFSMEYVEGVNLAELLRDGPLAPRRAATLLKTIAGAVAYAHAQGVLHRDLKPSNVLVDEQDQPHVTDFGLAKILTGSGELTVSGQVMGTPAYMSPEQGEGNRRAIGPASDIYSLGALLYHLLTGRPPFAAETPLETLRQAREQEPAALRALNASVPRDLETICLKCLAKEPERRYAGAEELEADLERFLRGEPIRARPVTRVERLWRWWKREPKLAGAITLALLLLVGLAVGASVAAYRVNAARAREFLERQRAETNAVLLAAQRREAVSMLTQLALVSAESAGKDGDAARAVAFLSQAVRQDPSNRVVLEQLAARLTQNEFAAPALPPLPHTAPVHHARFSPDGTRIVTACADGVVRLWDAERGQVVLEFKGHTGVVASAKFSPDGRSLVSAGHDGTVRVWDATSGRPRFTPWFHRAPWSTADFSPDETKVAAVRKGAVFFWDLRTGASAGPGRKHSPALTLRATHGSIPFASDGKSFLTVESGRVDILTGWTTNETPRSLEAGTKGSLLTHVALSPDGMRVAASGADDTAYLWDLTVATNRPSAKLIGHTDDVVFVGFSPDGSRIVTTATDKTARLWDGHSGRPLAPPLPHDGWVVFAQFSEDGLKLLTLADDRTVRVWDVMTGQRIGEPITHETKVLSAEFSPDGTRLVIACGQPWAQVWDIRPSRARPEVRRDLSGVHNLEGKFDANGRTLVGAKSALWRVDGLEPRAAIRALLGSDTDSAGLHWGPHGSWFIARLTNGDWRLHAYPAGDRLTGPLPHPGPIRHVAFSPDLCLTVGTNQVGRLWDARAGRLLRDTFMHRSLILDPVFSADGRRLLLACDENTFCLWDVAEGRPLGEPFARERNAITDAAFSPDGRRLVTVQYGSTGLLRDGESGRPVGGPLVHDQPLLCARFSPDGETLVTTSEDETARLWKAGDGTPLTAPLRHTSPVLWAAFSPDSRRLATFCEDGTARLWDVQLGRTLGQPMRLRGQAACGEFIRDGQRLFIPLRPSASTSEQPVLCETWVTPVPPLPAPSWLAGFVESWAGRRILDNGQAVPVPITDYFAARDGVLRQPASDYYVTLARWLTEDRAIRPVAPGADQRMQEYVSRLLEGTRADTLLENGRVAALLKPSDGLALAKLSLALSAQSKVVTSGPPTGSLAQALYLARRATRFAPRLPETWLAYGQASGLAGGPAGALAAIEEGLKVLPQDLVLLSGRASQLQYLGRLEEAVKAYDDALKVAEANPAQFATERREFLERRAALLQQLGR